MLKAMLDNYLTGSIIYLRSMVVPNKIVHDWSNIPVKYEKRRWAFRQKTEEVTLSSAARWTLLF